MGEHWLNVARRVATDHAAEEFAGVLLDATTANMLVQVHDALSEENQAKFASVNLFRAVELGWRLVERSNAKASMV